jgi:hypothetical protein
MLSQRPFLMRMTRSSWVAACLGGVLILPQGQELSHQPTPQESTVAELADGFVDPYNDGDAKALAAMHQYSLARR